MQAERAAAESSQSIFTLLWSSNPQVERAPGGLALALPADVPHLLDASACISMQASATRFRSMAWEASPTAGSLPLAILCRPS